MRIGYAVALAIALTTTTPAAADPWKDESGHGYAPYGRHDGEWKQEWRDGACKYERKWEGNGEYKEEVKCDGHDHSYPPAPTAYIPVPVPPSITIVIPTE